jgi:hypothetical protein
MAEIFESDEFLETEKRKIENREDYEKKNSEFKQNLKKFINNLESEIQIFSQRK